jgi:hypothetical protein
MRHLAAALLLLPAWSAAQTRQQTSSGNCSPNIVTSGSGPVTVKIIDSCNSLSPALRGELEQFLAQFPNTVSNLNELLHRKNKQVSWT